MLRRTRPNHPGPGRRSAGCGEFGIPPLSRNRQRLWGHATICGKRITLSQAGLWRGLGWQDHLGRLTHSRVLSMVKNPAYAGMYVFGRYQYRRQINPEGGVQKRIQAVAMSDWRVSLQDHHEGYITLEEFFENQEHLAKSRTNGEETLLAGPAREGLALLQGLLLCGTCGRALTVRYTGNGGIYPCYLCNRLRREGLASKD